MNSAQWPPRVHAAGTMSPIHPGVLSRGVIKRGAQSPNRYAVTMAVTAPPPGSPVVDKLLYSQPFCPLWRHNLDEKIYLWFFSYRIQQPNSKYASTTDIFHVKLSQSVGEMDTSLPFFGYRGHFPSGLCAATTDFWGKEHRSQWGRTPTIGLVCVSGQDYDLRPRYLVCRFNLTLSRSRSKFKVINKSSWSQDEETRYTLVVTTLRLGSLVAKALDLQLAGCEFNSGRGAVE